jgi:plasmid stabilization system protein ParE
VAFKIIYTEESLANLEAILDYIRADDPGAARRFGTALLNHIGLLATFPRIGAPIKRTANVRKFFHSPIRVYYHLDEERGAVEILHFWHAARREPGL